MRILASEQVQAWLAGLPPQSKHRVRLALRELAEHGRGDIKALEKELAGFCRLRVGGYRIIYRTEPGRVLKLEYAEMRDAVYETYLHFRELGHG